MDKYKYLDMPKTKQQLKYIITQLLSRGIEVGKGVFMSFIQYKSHRICYNAYLPQNDSLIILFNYDTTKIKIIFDVQGVQFYSQPTNSDLCECVIPQIIELISKKVNIKKK